MTDSMIETVARAMWQRDTERAKALAATLGAHYVAMTSEWDQSDLIWKDLARVAIAALREPTDAMIRAGGSEEVASRHFEVNEDIGDHAAEKAWRAMIDAALKEP